MLVFFCYCNVNQEGNKICKERIRIEIPKKNGKSELGAAIALNMLCNDDEWRAEVYSCASDRQQAAIVFDVAVDMVKQSPALSRRIKIIPSTKRMVFQPTGSIYQVLSSEVATKHGLNVSACIFDELHTQPTRALYDVMTQGSGDARKQPLWFLLTTAGTDRNSICWEVHQKALDIIEGRKDDPRFYPVLYGLPDDADWTDERNWYRANPSLDQTITIDKVRDAFRKAQETPADENMFRQLRLNQWVKQSVRWMPMDKWDECGGAVNDYELEGRECYAGLDLSSTSDLTAMVLVFPPRDEDEQYIVLPFFWLPEDTLQLRVRRDHVMYDKWERLGFLMTTEGNVVHYTSEDEPGDVWDFSFARRSAVLSLMNRVLATVPAPEPAPEPETAPVPDPAPAKPDWHEIKLNLLKYL